MLTHRKQRRTRFVNIDRDTPLLLPPDLRDWVESDHLVYFVIDAMDTVDTRAAAVNDRGTGSEQYPPTMLLALLVYSYATGVFSSRQIERSTYENVAVRLLCADTHPDHNTLCTFRRRNGALLTQAFAQVLEAAANCGVLNVGKVTVAIDGTKVLAKAEIEARAHARFVSEQATYYESVPSVSSNGVPARRNLASFKFGSGSLKDKH